MSRDHVLKQYISFLFTFLTRAIIHLKSRREWGRRMGWDGRMRLMIDPKRTCNKTNTYQNLTVYISYCWTLRWIKSLSLFGLPSKPFPKTEELFNLLHFFTTQFCVRIKDPRTAARTLCFVEEDAIAHHLVLRVCDTALAFLWQATSDMEYPFTTHVVVWCIVKHEIPATGWIWMGWNAKAF